MKKELINKSVNKMKYLFEYHFKSGSQRDQGNMGTQEEQPVKFSEIGDKYSNLKNDFPTFSEYRDEVVIDEDEPAKPEEEQPQAQPAPAEQPAPAPAPQPEPQAAPPVEPAPPVAPEPVAPAPAPVATPEPSGNQELEIKLNDQIAKTDQMLAMIQQLVSGGQTPEMGDGQDLSAKLDQLAKEVEDIKNPDYSKQFDMISKQSYPYNIKLSDYWGYKDETEAQEEKEQEYTITQADVDNYDPNAIKQSLNLGESDKK